MGRNTANYTLAEITTMKSMLAAGKTYKEIAETLERTPAGIYCFFQREKAKGKVNADKEIVSTSTIDDVEMPVVKVPRDMTPREMIKRLWDMGYRIENNKLVVITRTEVNLADIVRNG